MNSSDLPRRAIAALLWMAAFCFATGIFLSSTLLLRGLPPTPDVAIGRVTIENASKLRDYVTAGLFFIVVPALTIPLFRLGRRIVERFQQQVQGTGARDLVALLFVLPFFLAPFLYLTTFKWGWPLLIPLLLSQLLPRSVIAVHRTRWLRGLLEPELAPFHALVLTNAFAWILFRYIAVGKRIAHIPTLFLESVFVFFFLFIFWIAFVVVARVASFVTAADFEETFRRVAVAGLPLLALPLLALMFVPPWLAITIVVIAFLVAQAVAIGGRAPAPTALTVRRVVAYAAVPFLLYCFAYASTASLTQWVDLFHRGETLGPASDYLRGKVPYRDVFVLHGLLHDGVLDAWLMQIFGRTETVALIRPVVLGSFASPALWYLGMAIFNSIPLSIAVLFLGVVTTTDNERSLFEIVVLALLLAGTRTRLRTAPVVLSGVAAAMALFYSFDIGLYSIGGALLYLMVRAVLERRISRAPLLFLAGVAAGSAPFLIYFINAGVLDDFLTTSFVTIPAIIDAVWSVPFPNLTNTFRKNLSLHTIADFFLAEHFRYVLNPLVICVSLVVLVQRWLRRTFTWMDIALLALTAFAIPTQRSALGRADFTHQYFSAFLIGPMILVLLAMLVRALRPAWLSGDRNAQAFLIASAAAILPFFITALWIPDLINGRLDDTIRYTRRVKKIDRDPIAEDVAVRVGSVGFHVDELSPRGAPIFDFSNQPALYFFTERPNPTRFYQVPIMSPPAFQQEAIEALERTKTPIVLRRSPQQFHVFDGVDNAVRAQAVSAYIDDYYSYARTTRGVELWKRKPSMPKADARNYLRLIRVPEKEDLARVGERARLVFPGIGSTPGANQSLWRSDLILHNPFKEAMQLRLRYVAGDTRIDRRLTLASGRTIRWEDVVKTFFAAPDSLGVLWIEYYGARGPVARVKTYDASRNSTGSMESPLTMRDSANAYGDQPDLILVGLPGGGAPVRRINAGVVNVGDFPATFRITVHNRQGQQIGGAHEEGMAEDELALVADLDRRLGVAIDENMTVRIRMIAGTAIAYATIVDSTGGESHFVAAVPSPKP